MGTIADGDGVDGPMDASPVDVRFPATDLLPISLCGNGRLDSGEECDDGNTIAGDGCTALCQLECPTGSCEGPGAIVCGDGAVNAPESCDDGNVQRGDGCATNCTIETGWICPVAGHACVPRCGDGIVTGPETCDDGNVQSGDGCSARCVLEAPCFASDGSPAPCAPTCGNGHIDGDEACDDGPNNDDETGRCSTACHLLQFCGDGVVTPPETCDDGPGNAPDAHLYHLAPMVGCSALCTLPSYCGDATTDLAFGEQCDLGSKNGQPVVVGGRSCVLCDATCMLVVGC